MAERYQRRMADIYRQEAIDWFEDRVDLGLAEVDAAACRIRAMAPAKAPPGRRPRKKAA
jgi:hypothetical protein